MEETEKKNYNVAWMLGHNITDLEVCEDLKLDPSLAYTPAINQAATEAVYQRNIVDGVRDGLSESQAVQEAQKQRVTTQHLQSQLLKNKYV